MFFDFGGGPLNSVADVLIDAITDNEIIQYDSASGKYINRTLAEAGIADAASFLLDTTDTFTGNLTITGEAYVSGGFAVGSAVSPTRKFEVNAGTANVVAVFKSTDATADIYMQDDSTTGDNFVGVGASGDNMRLISGGAVTVTLDSSQNAIFAGNIDLPGIINNTPGSDIDATLLTVGVTGTPTFSWDESEDAFDFNKGLLIGGNVGIGVLPEAWDAAYSALQLSTTGTIAALTSALYMGENWYNDGSDKYTTTSQASKYLNIAGTHRWQVAASGTADTAITWVDAMRIDNSGDLLAGLTAGNDGKLHIDQASLTGAKPVLHLDQADLSEEFIKFSSTIGVGNPIEAVAAKTMTPTHFLRVELEGGLVRYINAGTIA